VTHQEEADSLAGSHVAKLLFIAFQNQRVVDPGKRFQSAVKNDKSWQCGSKVSSSRTQSSRYLLAIGVSGGNVTLSRIPATPPL